MEDIFSKEPLNTCNQQSATIFIDTREKNSLVPTNLIHKNANYVFQKLEIADYIIKDIAIERKTLRDFLSSMTSGRLIKQLIEIKKYKVPILLLEGFYYNYDDYNIHENAVRGMILSITTSLQIPIIYTQDEKDTAKMLILLARKKEKPKTEYAARPTKTIQTIEEQKRYILEGFPGIGPKKSKELINTFPNLKTMFNSDLNKILDPKTNENFRNILEN